MEVSRKERRLVRAAGALMLLSVLAAVAVVAGTVVVDRVSMHRAYRELAWREDFALRREALDTLATGELASGGVRDLSFAHYPTFSSWVLNSGLPEEEQYALLFLFRGETLLPAGQTWNRGIQITGDGGLTATMLYQPDGVVLRYEYADSPPSYRGNAMTREIGEGWYLVLVAARSLTPSNDVSLLPVTNTVAGVVIPLLFIVAAVVCLFASSVAGMRAMYRWPED